MTVVLESIGLPIEQAVEDLRSAGIERPDFEAQLLLAHATGSTRLDVLLGRCDELTSDEVSLFREYVDRRRAREPLAYIRGFKEFYGLEFEVSSAVLIPRPETELLVDAVVHRLRELQTPRFIDFGTGSGCIGIAALTRLEAANAIAVDCSLDALAVTEANAAKHGVSERLRLECCESLSYLSSNSVEMIVSNPPYIPSAEFESLQPEIRQYEPRIALDGGPDGVRSYRTLITDTMFILKPGGWLAVEVGFGQSEAVQELMRTSGLVVEEVVTDLSGVERVIVGMKVVDG